MTVIHSNSAEGKVCQRTNAY